MRQYARVVHQIELGAHEAEMWSIARSRMTVRRAGGRTARVSDLTRTHNVAEPGAHDCV